MNRIAPVRRAAWTVAAGALAVIAVPLAVPLAAQAAPARSQQPSAGTAVVRTAHFSPDTPGVDVYLRSYSGTTTTLWQSDLGYGDVSAYRPLKPGLYIVAMRKHGASSASPAGLTWTLNAKAGKAYTVAAVGTNNRLTGVVLPDTLTAPASGHGLIRVIQAASRASTARVVATPDTVVAADAKFATATGYTSVPAGTWTLEASTPSDSLRTTRTVDVKSGSIGSVIVLDAKSGGIQLRTITDATGSAVLPQGSIDAGGGGTAPAPAAGGAPFAPLAGTAAVLLLGTALLGTRSVRRRRAGALAGQ